MLSRLVFAVQCTQNVLSLACVSKCRSPKPQIQFQELGSNMFDIPFHFPSYPIQSHANLSHPINIPLPHKPHQRQTKNQQKPPLQTKGGIATEEASREKITRSPGARHGIPQRIYKRVPHRLASLWKRKKRRRAEDFSRLGIEQNSSRIASGSGSEIIACGKGVLVACDRRNSGKGSEGIM